MVCCCDLTALCEAHFPGGDGGVLLYKPHQVTGHNYCAWPAKDYVKCEIVTIGLLDHLCCVVVVQLFFRIGNAKPSHMVSEHC